jgi:Cu/Ag efflux pump CusA
MVLVMDNLISFVSPNYGEYTTRLGELGGVIPRVGELVDGEIFGIEGNYNRFKVDKITHKITRKHNSIIIVLRKIDY